LQGYIVDFQGTEPQTTYFNGRSDRGPNALASKLPLLEAAKVEVIPVALIATLNMVRWLRLVIVIYFFAVCLFIFWTFGNAATDFTARKLELAAACQ
jgi:hypothetical protein